jgi:hypothetical protein
MGLNLPNPFRVIRQSHFYNLNPTGFAIVLEKFDCEPADLLNHLHFRGLAGFPITSSPTIRY